MLSRREHVLLRTARARNVHDRDAAAGGRVRCANPRSIEAALFFFLEAVGVDAGEATHERRLAVIGCGCGAITTGRIMSGWLASRRGGSRLQPLELLLIRS